MRRQPWASYLSSLAGCAVAAMPAPASASPVDAGLLELILPEAAGEIGESAVDDRGDDRWRRPNRWRNGFELGLSVGLGAAWYWIDRDRQVGDWDFPSWRERFSTEILINDTNPFIVNYSWHTFGGAAFHLAGRSNDLGVIEAALWGFGASIAWEYGIEYREKADFNDLMFTTGAGVAMGEFVYWLGHLVQRQPASLGWDLARWTLGFPQTFHDSLDGRRGPRGPEIDHRFRVSSGLGVVSADLRDGDARTTGDVQLYHLRFEGELAAFDGLFPRGAARRGFRDGNFNTLQVRLTGGGALDGGTFLLADSLLAGWRFTRVSPGGRGDRGSALNLGTAVAVRYQREQYGPWRDRLGALHLPGLAADGDVWERSWRLRGRARVHADYGGIHSLAFDRWLAEHPDEIGKSILEAQGYYYGWGLSGRLEGELATPWATLGGAMFYGAYRSQQGFDRYQDKVTVDQLVRSRFLDYEVWLRGNVYRDAFVELRAAGQDRHERFEDLTASARLGRYTLELGTTF
jgi:hypothetical protein